MRNEMKYNPGFYQLREEQLKRMLEIIEQRKQAKEGGIVFFGDSLTQMNDLQHNYPSLSNMWNCGIGGASSEELLWIVDEAVLLYRPKIVVLMMGTNDLNSTAMASPKETAMHVKTIIDLIRGNLPDTRILLISTLPSIERLKNKDHIFSVRSNAMVQMIFEKYQEVILDDKTELLNVYPAFINPDGTAREELYQDALHLNSKGYEVLARLTEPVLQKLVRDDCMDE